jgi:hypothetical protein
MADLGNIVALKAAIAAILNNSVPDESIEPDDHNGLLVDLLDTITNGTIFQNVLVSGTNIKTVKGISLLGAGDVPINENATHTGEVTGATALTAQPTIISNKTAIVGALTGTEEVLVNDGTLKKVTTQQIADLGGAPFGKVGIPNSNGEYTYYNDVKIAIESATSGQIVFLFANCETTATITLPANVSLEGNGFKIYNHQADATRILELNSTVAHKTNWSNITFERVNGTSYVIDVLSPWSGNVQLTCSNVLITSDSPEYVMFWLNNNVGSFLKGLRVDAVAGIQIQNPITVTDCNVKTTTGICYFGNLSAKVVNSYGESLTGKVFNIPNVVSCYGVTSSGTLVGGYNVYIRNTILESSSGSIDAGFTALLKNSIATSTCSTFLVSGRAENSIITNNGTGAAFETFFGNVPSENSKFYSAGNVVANITNPVQSMQFTNCVIESAWNNAGGHGIICGTNSKITGCKIKVANASANCITSGTAYMANNTYEGATVPVAATQLITNLIDNQGNILM